MKNILVPVDFSECSGYAVEYAYAMANIYKSNVYIFHNISTNNSSWPSFGSKKEKFHEQQELKQKVEEELKKINSNSPIDKSRINTLYAEGNLIDNINECVNEYNIDFIVMGSHGMSGKKEFFIGSNTQKVVRSVDCSVFVVKNSIKNYQINKVVFASNFYPSDVEPLKYALEFLKPFAPELHLVEINTSGFYSQPYALEKEVLKDFQKMCVGYVCKTHFTKDYSVDSGVRRITDEIGADLIIISNNQNHPIKHFFRGSNVEFLVNHADVPVLSINI